MFSEESMEETELFCEDISEESTDETGLEEEVPFAVEEHPNKNTAEIRKQLRFIR